jgi:16S rRNA (cytosine967-C5)-methyltransferase
MHQVHRVSLAIKIIESYLGSAKDLHGKVLPLSIFLSQYYKANKQMGSKDRKIASELVYNFFRLGNILKALPLKDRLLMANFICQTDNNSYFASIFENTPFYNLLELSINEKISFLVKEYPQINLSQLFSFQPEFSKGLNVKQFYESFFIQPLLWIRVKKDAVEQVIDELDQNNINYFKSDEFIHALSFLNGTSLENLKSKQNGLFEVQDLSSQLTGKYFKAKPLENWWDCCAASGGKSLLLLDNVLDISMLVTDSRDRILINLKNRFQKARVKKFEALQADLMGAFKINKPLNFFDGIIADVPCSGSGTWARTPEMLSFFPQESILEFQHKQKTIASNVIPFLKPGQAMIYITCSVFKSENEDVVNYLSEKYNLQIEISELIRGYNLRSDTLFVSRLIKRK